MNIHDRCNVNPAFKAKVHLNNVTPLVSNCIKGNSCIDVMFHENRTVRAFNDVSVWITKNILNKSLKNPTNIITKNIKQATYYFMRFTRVLSNKLFVLSNKSSLKTLGQKLQPDSKEYIEEIAKIGNGLNKKFININVEDNPLEKVTHSKNATIFVLNHPNYHKDKFSYIILNSLLSKFYVAQGKQADCPRSKVLVSKNMLNVVGKNIGKIYENLGMIPIDASIYGRDKQKNTQPIMVLLKEFIKNKSNIFIFPEGNNSLSKTMPLEARIQLGTASLIKRAINNKSSVRVIPIGLHYTKEKGSLGNIFVGKPMFFKKSKSGNEIIFTQGTDMKKIERVGINDSIPVIFKEICDNLRFGMQKDAEM